MDPTPTPTSIPPSRPYRAIASKLATLPVEIVHKIISDIQISKILTLITIHPNPYLDSCITSHLELRKLLPAEDLPEIKHLTMIKLRVTPVRSVRAEGHGTSVLEADIQSVLQRKPSVDSTTIRNELVDIIVASLSRFSPAIPVYQEYHDQHKTGVLIPPPFTWDSVASAEELDYIASGVLNGVDGLKQQQSAQLSRLAALVRDNHFMLKSVDDPSQESRTDSHRLHLAHLFRQFSRTTLNRERRPISSVFSGRVFPLVPYDRYLHMFYKTLDRWPQSRHPYPPQLQVVLKGMYYVYPRNGQHVENGSDVIAPSCLPRTVIDDCGIRIMNKLPTTTYYDVLKDPLDVYRPWPEAEFEWLKAFVAICRYMSGMKEKWYKAQNRAETVGDFWEKHLGEMKSGGGKVC